MVSAATPSQKCWTTLKSRWKAMMVMQPNRNHVGKVGVPPTRRSPWRDDFPLSPFRLDHNAKSPEAQRTTAATSYESARAGGPHDCDQAATAWGAGWAVAGRGCVCARSHSRGPCCPSRRGDTFCHTSAWYSSTHRFSCSLSICRTAAPLPPSCNSCRQKG